MPESVIDLPDGKKLVVFETDRHPDFLGTSINVQEVLGADIPTYTIVADNVSPALNKNILTIFNNLPTKRIRVQEVFVYPKTGANNTITLQLGYINSIPVGGTDASINKHAADFDSPPAPPNTLIAVTGNTSPAPVAGLIYGGNTFNLNTAATYIIYEKKGNASALQLRPQPNAEGLVLRQTAGSGTTGSLCAHFIVTLD